MARTPDSFIKDIPYHKYYVVFFNYRDDKYVFCKEGDSYTFKPINKIPVTELSTLGVMKYDTEEEAQLVTTKIPEFTMEGNDVFIETTSNMFEELLIGA